MFIQILRNSEKSLNEAKKRKVMKKTILTLVEACIVIGLATSITMFRSLPLNSASIQLAATTGIAILSIVLLTSIVLGFVTDTIMRTLGGKGKYYEAITAIAFTLVPISTGILLASIALLIPIIGPILAFLFLLPYIALGLAMLYKSIKELFSVDMITAYTAVTIMLLTEFVSLYALLFLSLISGIGPFIS